MKRKCIFCNKEQAIKVKVIAVDKQVKYYPCCEHCYALLAKIHDVKKLFEKGGR